MKSRRYRQIRVRLVAKSLPLHHRGVTFPTMGHRAWFAWQCLERDDRGQPPKWRELERRHKLPNAALRRLVWDISKRPGYPIIVKSAAALNCTPEWLMFETGPGPTARWPVLPRPAQAPAEAGNARLSDELQEGQATSEDGVLNIVQGSSEDVPSRGRVESANKSKAATGKRKAK